MDRVGTAGYRAFNDITNGYVCTPVCQLRAGYRGRPRGSKIGNNSAIRVCNPSDGTVSLQGTKISTTPWECAPATSYNRHGRYGDSLSQSTKVRVIPIRLQGMGYETAISQDVPKPANSICRSRTPHKGK